MPFFVLRTIFCEKRFHKKIITIEILFKTFCETFLESCENSNLKTINKPIVFQWPKF